jgi:hypothetical protein
VVRACAPARCRLRTRSAVAAPAAPPTLRSCARAQTHVFIKHAGDAPAEGEAYVKLKIDSASCEDVADLVALACAAYGWVASSRARLHLVLRAAAGGGGAPSAEDERRALAGDALFPAASLRSAGVEAGALLLARVPPGAGACPCGARRRAAPGVPCPRHHAALFVQPRLHLLAPAPPSMRILTRSLPLQWSRARCLRQRHLRTRRAEAPPTRARCPCQRSSARHLSTRRARC